MKNKTIHAKIIQRPQSSQEELGEVNSSEKRHMKLIEKAESKGDLKSRAEILSGHNYCIQNWKFKGAEEAFPNEPWLRCVGKYYPEAIGGPLLIDEPTSLEQMKQCERKRKYLAGLGYSYLILKPEVNPSDDQLELERCRGQIAQ